jgi:tRNA-2-methylthio-N6-dimethylallyladenosine synthase
MNVHDSEKMLGVLEKEGYCRIDDPQKADLILFNTCGIRKKAEQKFYSELGRMKAHKKKRPGIRIAVAGCIAQQEGRNIFKKAPHVDFIFGPQNIHMLGKISKMETSYISLDENPDIAARDLPVKRESGIRAWVTIMYGCNNFCSYCVVPYTRGREKSRPSENICREVTELAEKGCREITLLGQNVNSYRSDLGFTGLLRKLNGVNGIERIRFVTSHPKDLSLELIGTIADLGKVCEHIHLPLQSGSNGILKRMNRGYTYEEYLKKVTCLKNRVPGISVTSDIISGFPGETEHDHDQTLRALKEIEFDGIFAFNFSPRPFTKAAEMKGQLPDKIKTDRLEEILSIQDEITVKKNRVLEGTIQEILIEGASEKDNQKLTGRTRANKIVNIPRTDGLNDTLIDVEIIKARKHSFEGKPLEP